jgi:hypothetical protein
MQENFHLLHLTYAQRITAAPVSVTYNDKGGREKIIIWQILNENNFNNKYFKLTLMK